MADLFNVGVYDGAGSKDLTVADHDNALGPGTPSNYKTGDLRRKYNFGDRVSELNLAQDPFFRFLSKVSKKPTDDPTFKWAEKRPSWNKRYAYVMGFKNSAGTGTFGDSTITASDSSLSGSSIVVGSELTLYMAGDYKTEGNVQNIYGNTTNDWTAGASGTTPQFFLPGQIIKIPTMTDAAAATTSWGASYMLCRVSEVVTLHTATAIDSKYPAEIKVEVVKIPSSSYVGFAGFYDNGFAPGGGSATDEVTADQSIADLLERARTYVVGTAHAEGSGYPETWKDQPYATNHGLTQIWKTSMAMSNTARATSLKFDSSEWARVWREKLIEHKWDIETSLLFGSQYTDTTNDIQYTQGAVDYISDYGNQFSLDPATKSQDSFLDDLSNYLDPRYNSSKGSIFFCNTAVYNWLHKLSGYFANNVGIVQPGAGNTTPTSFPALTGANAPLGRADMTMTGKSKVLGVDVNNISTPFGDMNVVRNIHLDGTNVKMLGINMNNCKYRPLVGNGLNRDTSVYVGVQTLENSGIDRRVDLILTEAGMEWSMPESHAIWT